MIAIWTVSRSLRIAWLTLALCDPDPNYRVIFYKSDSRAALKRFEDPRLAVVLVFCVYYI